MMEAERFTLPPVLANHGVLVRNTAVPVVRRVLASAAFLIGTNKTLNQDLEPNQVCSTCRFLQRE